MKRIAIITTALLFAPLATNADVAKQTSKGFELGASSWPTFEELKAEADKGEAKAMYVLGWAYDEGVGVAENDRTAKDWYQKSSEGLAKLANNGGDVDAMLALGELFMEGDGVAKDKKAGAEWFRKASDAGSVEGTFQLGKCYEDGDGVPKDKVKAAELFKAAADKGHRKAKKELRELQEDDD